ncbi:MAG TPA: hypothetical protein VGB99_15485 [Acidobacteriota bacterium]|jgi:hypothetical protein
MKGLVITLVTVGLLVLVGRVALREYTRFSEQDQAKGRVTAILQGIRDNVDDRGLGLQTPVCMWAAGVLLISDAYELGRASDQFDDWRREGDIWKVSSFEVTGAELQPGSVPPLVIVSGTVNGKPFKLRVPKGDTISWIR